MPLVGVRDVMEFESESGCRQILTIFLLPMRVINQKNRLCSKVTHNDTGSLLTNNPASNAASRIHRLNSNNIKYKNDIISYLPNSKI